MADSRPIKLVVGLGNPGDRYRLTRHNAGFQVVDALVRGAGAAAPAPSRFPGEVGRLRLGDSEVWLLKPTTFMNESGAAVQPLAAYYHIEPSEILVIHDELDLPPGAARMKLGGGNAGHNGLRDICLRLGAADFWRLRVGIGHPRQYCPQEAVHDWVLGQPGAEHRKAIDDCVDWLVSRFDGALLSEPGRSARRLSRPAPLPEPAADGDSDPD